MSWLALSRFSTVDPCRTEIELHNWVGKIPWHHNLAGKISVQGFPCLYQALKPFKT